MRLACLEGNLQDFVPQAVSVEAGDGHGRLFVIGHCDEAEASAFVGVEVADDFDVGDCPERAEHLPQKAFVAILTQVVNENAPTRGRAPSYVHARNAAHVVHTHWWEPREDNIKTWQSETGPEAL